MRLLLALPVFFLAGCEALGPAAGATATGVIFDSVLSSAEQSEVELKRHEAYAACRDREAALANGDPCICAIEYQIRTPITDHCFLVRPLPQPVPVTIDARTVPSAEPVQSETEPPEVLREAEGTVLAPYPDVNGLPHIGIGHQITQQDAERLLQADWATAREIAQRVLGGTWAALDDTRQEAVTELAFSMGEASLLTFTELLGALRRGHYRNAAAEVLDSDWARQVQSGRAERIAAAIRNGNYEGTE